jgi:uncharacterized membrane protein YsdA (DUF1294 family)
MCFAGFFSMSIDKRRAKKNLWRIPERTLLLIALLGGAPGTLFGMFCCRHKIRSLKFMVPIPALTILHLGIIFYIWFLK